MLIEVDTLVLKLLLMVIRKERHTVSSNPLPDKSCYFRLHWTEAEIMQRNGVA